MNLMLESVKTETKKVALEIVSIFNPAVATVGSLVQWQENISNTIFLEKLYQILMKQDSDFDDWLKISGGFCQGSDDYEKQVKQLIFAINAINDMDLLDVYANLLHAYKLQLLTKDEFFHLSWVLSSVYYGDLIYLKECFQGEKAENYQTIALANMNLLKFSAHFAFDYGSARTYCINKNGLLMLACGLDYENYPNYKESLKAYET